MICEGCGLEKEIVFMVRFKDGAIEYHCASCLVN